jgi:hypoxanthine phosphoribosyltransferase
MELNYSNAKDILTKSSILYDEQNLDEIITTIAKQIDADIVNDIPIFFTVMNGGLFFAAKLLQKIKNPFICDYIHASRYGNETFGSSHITWFRQPKFEDINGKNVYIIDDILDEGHTLAEVKRFLLNAGAKQVKIIVLINKEINKEKPVTANYIGTNAPNHFLFGYGMDIFGLYRQLPAIYVYNNK